MGVFDLDGDEWVRDPRTDEVICIRRRRGDGTYEATPEGLDYFKYQARRIEEMVGEEMLRDADNPNLTPEQRKLRGHLEKASEVYHKLAEDSKEND